MRRNAGPRLRRRPVAPGVARGIGLVALALLPPAAAAQAKPDTTSGAGRARAEQAGAPAPPAPAPAGGARKRPAALPPRRPAPPPRAPAKEGSPWSFVASGRADVGYDTNVFQTDSATGDAFSEVGGAASLARDDGRGLFRIRLDVRRKFYRRFSQADELTGFMDLTGSRQFGPLRAGAVLTGSYLDLRVFDREGNLLPRSNFASVATRGLTYGDLRVTRNLYLSTEATYRIKNYEETAGLTSLDYAEWRAELGLTRYLPARFSIRLAGGGGRRDYRELTAAESSGAIAPGNPDLELEELDGEARLRKRWAKTSYAQAVFGLRRNEDLFEGEFSSDQTAASARVLNDMGGWLFDVYGGLLHRAFDVHRGADGEPFEETYLTVESTLERVLWPGARLAGGYELLRRRTGDGRGEYTVGTWQLGLRHVF